MEDNMQKKKRIIKKIITWIITLILLVVAIIMYNRNNFNDYTRAEAENGEGITSFVRDNNVKYSKTNSYRIENKDYNDAMFFKKITVIPNTSYRVSCMIKTQDVVNQNVNTDAGAHICLNQSTEKSDNVIGSTDWTKVEFVFNSKNRKEVEVGFRLGGNFDNSKGTAWFSDMMIESGTAEISDTWSMACIIFDKTDVNLNINGQQKNFNLSLSQEDISDMKLCMSRFANSIYQLSNKKMIITYDIIEIGEPITSMSYDEENGFYVSPYDVKNVIDPYIKEGKYDHIFVAFRTGDINAQNEIPVNDWIGLGGMEYRNIGFSNIRLPNSDSNYIYKYDERVNVFPEEVFVHEFLHTLERNAEEYGYERPELHSFANYGYKTQSKIGLREWYTDYMNKSIKTEEGILVGLPAEIFNKKPSKTSDFSYSRKLDSFKEPENLLEELNGFYKKIVNLFTIIKVKNNEKINEV